MPAIGAAAKKPWQKGFELSKLRQIAACFKEFDKGLVLGAFGSFKENSVADWLSKNALATVEKDGETVAAAVITYHNGSRTVNGFAGPVGVPAQGAARVRRIACLPGFEMELIKLVTEHTCEADEIWIETWVESGATRRVCDALGAVRIDTKVMAASELIGIYYAGDNRPDGTSAADLVTLKRLALPPLPVAGIAKHLAGLKFADHYSGYNKGKSWAALALRGFSPTDPGFIIKPAEMSKKWKDENSESLAWECSDTPLRKRLPAIEPLIKAVPGDKERIRLMRLAPGGGELLRHADITDPDAGTKPGELLRIHIPIVTNPQVVFTQWLLDGSKVTAFMKQGEAWYLDTRKPHTAVNGGQTERIHLVMDCKSSPALLKLLGC